MRGIARWKKIPQLSQFIPVRGGQSNERLSPGSLVESPRRLEGISI